MEISTNYIPGALGEITAMHGRYYAEHWNFGVYFEAKVARELGEFLSRRKADDLLLLAVDEAGIAASLILDLNDPASGARGAHLRWFIVAKRLRGTGLGREFMRRAVEHADQHTGGAVWLTTFAGLEPARHLYESFGFQLISEEPGKAWGTEVMEQEFRRSR